MNTDGTLDVARTTPAWARNIQIRLAICVHLWFQLLWSFNRKRGTQPFSLSLLYGDDVEAAGRPRAGLHEVVLGSGDEARALARIHALRGPAEPLAGAKP